MPTELPLVSAIMPTRGRRGWAAEALEMFHAQIYPRKEIVIVDDASDRSFLAPPSGASYLLRPSYTIGAKRNIAVAYCSGPIVCHWDSDDVYLSDRISSQVKQLLASGADLIGYHTMPFVEADGQMRRFEYRSLDKTNCIGVSMMYWRSSWERSPFPSISEGEDCAFQEQRTRSAFPSEGRIVARIHSGNTSNKRKHFHLTDQWGQVA